MPSKIEVELPTEKVDALCAALAALPGGSRLAVIQRMAREYGVTVSQPAAGTFRDGRFAEYLAELKSRREMAEQVSAVAQGGQSLSDAAASILTQKILDQTLDLDTGDEEALSKSNALSLSLSRLRTGDHRARKLAVDLKVANERLTVLVAEREEREKRLHALATAAKEVTEKSTASPDEVRAQVVSLVDEVFGFTRNAKK